MFLLVSIRHVGAHPGEHQHGVSIQISVSLGKTFLRISRIRNIPLTSILARVFIFVYVPSFISQILDFIYWTVLNGVTLKTSNTFTYNIHLLTVLFCALCLNLLSFVINFLEVVKKFKKRKLQIFLPPNWKNYSFLQGSRSLFLTQPFFESSRKASGRLISRAKVRIKAEPKKMKHVT